MWHRTTFPGDWWDWSRHGSVPTSSPERQQLNLNDGIASGAPPRWCPRGGGGGVAARLHPPAHTARENGSRMPGALGQSSGSLLLSSKSDHRGT